MNMRFRGDDEKLLVAVNFDALSDGLVSVAKSLCSRTKMKMRITHISEPWKGRPWISTFPGENISYEVARVVEEKNLKEAGEQLSAKLKDWGLDSVETNVVSERVGHGISADAVSNRASLILTATQSNHTGPVLRGFSTAMGLLAESNIPVLTVPEGATVDFGKKGLKIAVCDDLEEGSLSAVHGGFEFAAATEAGELHHIHVNKMEKSEVQTFVKYIQEAMNNGVVPQNDHFSADAVLKDSDGSIKNKMTDRSSGYQALAASKGCKYQAHVLHGTAQDALAEFVKKHSPDVIIFGRHETIHKKPFSIGKLPFHAMLGLNTPIMMIPSVTYLA